MPVSDLYATQTPTANVIPIADGSGRLNDWVDALVNPMTSEWDLVVGGVAGVPERLAVGIPGDVLTVGSGGEVVWEAPASSFVIQGTAGEIDVVSDGSGVVTISLPSAITLTGKSITGGAFFVEELNGPIGVTTPDTIQATTIGLDADLTFSATGQRILGDLSNATVTDRLFFQNSVANSNSNLGVLPSGSGTIGILSALNNSDPTNAGLIQIRAEAASVKLLSGAFGAGTILPFILDVGGTALTVTPTTFAAVFAGSMGAASLQNTPIGSVTPASAVVTSLRATDQVFVDDGQRGISIGGSNFGAAAINVLAIKNGTPPGSSPGDTGQIYVEGGALKFRGAGGTITTVAPT